MSAHTLASNILMEMPGLKKRQKKLMAHRLWLFLSVRGRINFEQLGRYGHYNECTFQENFSKGFDFLSFNQEARLAFLRQRAGHSLRPELHTQERQAYRWAGPFLVRVRRPCKERAGDRRFRRLGHRKQYLHASLRLPDGGYGRPWRRAWNW